MASLTRRNPFRLASCLTLLLAVLMLAGAPRLRGGQEPGPLGKDEPRATLPRGKKLVLKDGTYQLIREYQRSGDHVRYLSAERGEWEEIPASMVDWDATARAAAEDASFAKAVAEKARAQEQAQRMDRIMDVDASLQVGDGLFLPPGEGLFVVEGKFLQKLDQVGSELKTDKKRTLESVLSPIPIVPGKKNVVIPGARAALRVHTATPEFYLREAPPDPDRVSPVVRSSRPGESGPELELIRAKVNRNSRQVESVSTLFGQVKSTNRNTVSVQRWEIAPTVYRFTIVGPLPPGEYVLAEVLPDGLNYYVWDFGVDAPESK